MKSAVLAALIVLAFASAQADTFIGMGGGISRLADLPEEEFGGLDAGLAYRSCHLLFVPVFCFDRRFVLYGSGNAYPLEPAQQRKIEALIGAPLVSRINPWLRWGNWAIPALAGFLALRRLSRRFHLRQIDEYYDYLYQQGKRAKREHRRRRRSREDPGSP